MRKPQAFLLVIIFFTWSSSSSSASAQSSVAPSPSSSLAKECVGVVLEYQVASVSKIFPFLPPKSSKLQPFRFQSTLSVTNTGFQEVNNWQAFIGFQHNEWLTQAEGVVLADGQKLPAQVGNAGATLAGFPQTDIRNSIETAGDYSKIQLSVNLLGTEFGVAPPHVPMPTNLSLVSDGWECGLPHKIQDNRMRVCCSENRMDISLASTATKNNKYLPREMGDITISYDVLQTFQDFYWAQVTISNDDPVGRLDNWNLSWEWTQGEFIHSMRGAQTSEQEQRECIHGPAGEYYTKLDFSQAMNCQRSPTIVDLDQGKANDTELGQIPFCCRNGTLLPAVMDPSKAKSVFQLQVYKIPPHQGRDKLVPPASFRIGRKHQCGHPRLVSPSEFPAPGNALHYRSAVISWQITCNLSVSASASSRSSLSLPASPPSCCVSFSAFYNDSVVPCPTCACGCPFQGPNPSCDSTAEALLLPAEALLIPSSNRTSAAARWNAFNRNYKVPTPAPCGDFCGISINWHILSDHEHGWSARMSILNWNAPPVADWFAVVELNKAIAGFRKSYSFNATLLRNVNAPYALAEKKKKSLFLQGEQGLNYIVGEQTQDQLAGKAQSLLSFSKKGSLSNLRISAGDGFPSKVLFNGEECTLPTSIPQSSRAAPVVVDFNSCMIFIASSFASFILSLDFCF